MMNRCALQKEIGHGTDRNQSVDRTCSSPSRRKSRSGGLASGAFAELDHEAGAFAWIDQEEERSRLTREALADVDAGRVIDHQAVQAWADSLVGDKVLPLPR